MEDLVGSSVLGIPPDVMTLDCQRCGACCTNPEENRQEGYPWYVEVDDPSSKLLTDPTLRKRYVTPDAIGVPHLRMVDQRCAALKGRLGDFVSCQVYRHRPAPCRRVEPGSDPCLQSRRERGLG